MDKKLRTLNFEHRDDIARFVNFNKVPKEDIVSIDAHKSFGIVTMYTLSFYADETLVGAIRYHQKIIHRSIRKEKKLVVIASFLVIMFIILVTFLPEIMGL